jgi:mannose-6-phosphate isomerase-like protein (cupin superfamily)
MRQYAAGESHLLCGHWNGSPLEIGLAPTPLKEVPNSEVMHYHNYHEYYVVLEGSAELEVEGQQVPLRAGNVVMVEPGEIHRIASVDPELGARWVIIKERSEPDSKHIVVESGR